MGNALPSSFWAKVEKTEACWIWKASKVRSGYGVVHFNGRQRPAHRVAYEAVNGTVPTELDIDHLCRNRACVNPSHLEAVTRRVNLLRSPITLTAQKAAQKECVNGHEFTPGNTDIRSNGTRRCRECSRVRSRMYEARKRGAGK